MNDKTTAYLLVGLFLSTLLILAILSVFDRWTVVECIKHNPNAVLQCKELI